MAMKMAVSNAVAPELDERCVGRKARTVSLISVGSVKTRNAKQPSQIKRDDEEEEEDLYLRHFPVASRLIVCLSRVDVEISSIEYCY